MVKIETAKTFNLTQTIEAKENEVVSMKAIDKENSYLSLFALATNEEITAEAMCGERYYFCFSGNGEIELENNKKNIRNGEFFKIEKDKAYSLKSIEDFRLIEVGEKIGVDKENKFLNELNSAEAINLKDCVKYQVGKIISKNLVAKKDLVMTVMSFDKGENLEPHKAPGDALITVLDGVGEFIVDGKPFIVKKDESAILPANIPHAVKAVEKFKMLLVLVK